MTEMQIQPGRHRLGVVLFIVTAIVTDLTLLPGAETAAGLMLVKYPAAVAVWLITPWIQRRLADAARDCIRNLAD